MQILNRVAIVNAVKLFMSHVMTLLKLHINKLSR